MIFFTIETTPVAQKQTRFSRNGFHTYDPSKKDKDFLQWQMKAYAPKEPFKGPVAVDYTFYLPIPKNTSRIKRRQMINGTIHHISRPDVDNLAYLVTNAMKGILIEDDSQITDSCIHKRYGEIPRIVVKVIDLLEGVRKLEPIDPLPPIDPEPTKKKITVIQMAEVFAPVEGLQYV